MKGLAIYLKKIFPVAAGCLLAACTLEQGEAPPRATQGEYAVYGCVRALDSDAMRELRLVFGFDRYLEAATELERQVVRDRFFPFMLVSGADGVWSLSREGRRYDFVLTEGLRLEEPGAAWSVWYWQEGDAERRLIGTFAAENGAVHCAIGSPRFESAVDWLATAEITDDEVRITAHGNGRLLIPGNGPDSWTVTYATPAGAPLVWSEQFVAGEWIVEASLPGAGRKIEFLAKALEHDAVRIEAREHSEVWGASDF